MKGIIDICKKINEKLDIIIEQNVKMSKGIYGDEKNVNIQEEYDPDLDIQSMTISNKSGEKMPVSTHVVEVDNPLEGLISTPTPKI